MWLFYFKSFWSQTPKSLKTFTLSISLSPVRKGGGWGCPCERNPHVFSFFAFRDILLSFVQLSTASTISCVWLCDSLRTTSYCVQSSAYLHVSTASWKGIVPTRSLICILNSVCEITVPCGTPVGKEQPMTEFHTG